MDEPLAESEIEVEKTPLGIQLTLQFLRLLVVVLIFPLVGTAVMAFVSLIMGAISSASGPEAIAFGIGGLGSFILVMTLISASAWMDCHLNRSAAPFASAWVAGRPGHPARQLILPAIGSIAVYGYAAVVFWIAADPGAGGEDPERTSAWPGVWGSAAAVATVLYRYLRARLPE